MLRHGIISGVGLKTLILQLIRLSWEKDEFSNEFSKVLGMDLIPRLYLEREGRT